MNRSDSMNRNRSLMTLFALALILTGTGCAQVMAAQQPPPLDREFLQPGVERPVVTSALGAPTTVDRSEGQEQLTESYSYVDGGAVNHWLGKTARILLYTGGDVFTLFLSQVIWIPAELLLDGTEYQATVDYERRASDGRWVAAQIVERDKEGEESFARGARTSVQAAADSPASEIAAE